MPKPKRSHDAERKITRYSYDNVKEPIPPETGQTPLLPPEEHPLSVPLDNGWTKAVNVGKLPEPDSRDVVVDLDPAVDPVLFWSGKRSKRDVPILPLQRSEIVSDSKIARIVENARRALAGGGVQSSLTAYFSDLEKALREDEKQKRVEFYVHEEGWKNRLICGDSLQVIESLIYYEGMKGRVQMIYIDPPYGISYDSNFQQRVDTTRNDVGDKSDDVLTIKAYRDTWTLGIHSYLSYLTERLYLCRELLQEGGSIFVQMNQETAHLVRNVLDEVFGARNFVSMIAFTKTGGQSSTLLGGIYDVLLWYAKDRSRLRFNRIYIKKQFGGPGTSGYVFLESPDGKQWRSMTTEEREDPSLIPNGWHVFDGTPLNSAGESGGGPQSFEFKGKQYATPPNTHWKTTLEGLRRLAEKNRIIAIGNRIEFKRYFNDFPYNPMDNIWLGMGERGFVGEKLYSVQTDWRVVARCIQMTTAPGDLVFDPTCGSGTTAYCAERLGRRWITCDTSRVAINITRKRLLSAVFEHYKTRNGRVSGGFLYEMANHVTLKSLANDLEPEKVELIDRPVRERDAVRVTGPFEVMSLGRYSLEDWKGYVAESGKLENYIEVICRLYRKDASTAAARGLVHAVWESEKERIAISVGPLTGRVSGKQINDAAQDAISLGILELHVLGWAFEANVGEVKSRLESGGRLKVQLVMIRLDVLAEGLKAERPEMLFSPLALPDVEVNVSRTAKGKAEAVVALKGVGVFDRKTKNVQYYAADSGYISAWYLDEDYDGDCFVDCQMFFDFTKTPNLRGLLGLDVDASEFRMKSQSLPFSVPESHRIAVKVVDVFGNESSIVKEIE